MTTADRLILARHLLETIKADGPLDRLEEPLRDLGIFLFLRMPTSKRDLAEPLSVRIEELEQLVGVELLRNHVQDLKRDLDKIRICRERQAQDILYLLTRAGNAGRCVFGEPRDFGVSSNALVRLAYGGPAPSSDELPKDLEDLEACRLALERLPEHRRTEGVLNAFEAGRAALARPEVKLKAMRNG